MRRDILTSAITVVVFTVLLGLVYPLVVTGISQVAFSHRANGSQIKVNGKLVGSELIGQAFADQVVKGGKPQVDKMNNPVSNPDPKYFQSRPSATVPAYNAAGTAFSNLGPNSVATQQAIAANVQTYLGLERPYVPGLTVGRIPVDAVNSSASGVDPEISVANADIQAHRLAAVRHLPLGLLMSLIAKYTRGRSLGIFGEPGVNALQLNLALDRASGAH